MASDLGAICDKIVTRLSGSAWPVAMTIGRVLATEDDLKHLTKFMSVFPSRLSSEDLSGDSDDFRSVITIEIIGRVREATATYVDPMLQAVEEVFNDLGGVQTLDMGNNTTIVGVECEPVYDVDLLADSNVFRSHIHVELARATRPRVPTVNFLVDAPGAAIAGAPVNFTVTARDRNGDTATGYGGTVNFSSNDGAAALPAASTLTNGTGVFSVTFNTAGSRSIVAADSNYSAVTGSDVVSVT